MDKIGCALIGLGYWGSILKKYINSCQYFEIKEEYSRKRTDITYEELLARTDIKVFFICTSLESHYDLAKKAIGAGKHVFCEKPLTNDVNKAKELFFLAHQRKVVLYTDYIYTQSRAVKKVKALCKEIGQLKSIRMEICQFGRFYDDAGAIAVIGVHMLSVLAYLFDYSCEINKGWRRDAVRNDNGDELDSDIRFSINEADCSLTFSLICPEKVRRFLVVGEKGSIQFDMMSPQTVSAVIYSKSELGMIEKKRERYEYDESNNIPYVLEDFIKTLNDPDYLDNEKCCLEVENISHKLKQLKIHQENI